MLDRMVGSFDSLDGYKRYLRGAARFQFTLEPAIDAIDWPIGDEAWRPKLVVGALQDDLADLAVAHPATLDHEVTISSKEARLGFAYVLLGSQFGSNILLDRAQMLGLSDKAGARHLAEQSRQQGAWRHFLDVLESDDTVDLVEVVSSANTAFGLARSSFAANG